MAIHDEGSFKVAGYGHPYQPPRGRFNIDVPALKADMEQQGREDRAFFLPNDELSHD